MNIDRRNLLKAGVVAGAGGLLGVSGAVQAKSGSGTSGGSTEPASDVPEHTSTAVYDPRRDAFQLELFKPDPMQKKPFGTLSPAPGDYPGPRVGWRGGPAHANRDPSRVNHGIAQEFEDPCADWNRINPGRSHEVEYSIAIEQATQNIVPRVESRVFVYRDLYSTSGAPQGFTPGPTILATFRVPSVLRVETRLTKENVTLDHDVETSVHYHGGHIPAHADGYPDFYVLASEARDYYYPNIVPRRDKDGGCGDPFDKIWIPSTQWYHDHGMDITGFNVSQGLAGFYLMTDDLEQGLIADGVLPEVYGELDIPLAIQDQKLNPDGSIAYDFLDHNGRIGDVFTVNGRAQPFARVQRRKYRLRLLNASNARVYQIRLSTRKPFLVIGHDDWLLPHGIFRESVQMVAAERYDIIVDFTDAPDEVFLENIMVQEDGRKPKGVDPSKERTPLVKFIVEGPRVDPADDLKIDETTPLRPHIRIRADEIVATRVFRFERANGAWTVNNRLFNPRRADAVPELGCAERWILENNSGGWWHPIHIHLEGFQLQKLNGKQPPFELSIKKDTVALEDGGTAEIFMKFRTFSGPFVFHCHTIEHEDMRMMATHDPRPDGEPSPLDGESRIDPVVPGVVDECLELEEDGRLLFDVAGDVERLDDRGVGFPECEFNNDRRGNRGRSSDPAE
ncbi:MAG: hypothetical protein E4H03_08360 [Myxococcales bacterium]|nr:MAG: hypothetical protein E4H03_08360 [Myxococcales bacterium]